MISPGTGVTQDKNTEYNTIVSKWFEIIFLNVVHQKFDGQNGYDKCGQHANDQDGKLITGKVETKFYQF